MTLVEGAFRATECRFLIKIALFYSIVSFLISFSVYCFAINCTKDRKTYYLNTYDEEAKGKQPGL